jgi:hypothetical protein
LVNVYNDLLAFLVGSSLAVYNISNSFHGSHPLQYGTPPQGVRGLIYVAVVSAAGVGGAFGRRG